MLRRKLFFPAEYFLWGKRILLSLLTLMLWTELINNKLITKLDFKIKNR